MRRDYAFGARSRLGAVALGCIAARLLVSTSAGAAPGAVDSTFGQDGRVTTAIGRDAGIVGVVIDHAGGIVAAGWTTGNVYSGMALARYDASGVLDPAFGDGGTTTRWVDRGSITTSGVAIDAQGRIVVSAFTGQGNTPDHTDDFLIARFEANGRPDASFGDGGVTTTAIGTGDDRSAAIAIDPDGRIVVAGWADVGPYEQMALARYDANGRVDESFGIGGKVTVPVGFSYSLATAVAIDEKGRIVVVGEATTEDLREAFGVIRLDVDGRLDEGFGDHGRVLTHVGDRADVATEAMIDGRNRILVVGSGERDGKVGFALIRCLEDGRLDASFGESGKVVTSIGPEDAEAFASVIDRSGRIVAVGDAASDFAIVRYRPNGMLDASFGDGGQTTTPIGTSVDLAVAVAIYPEGRAIAAGSSLIGPDRRSQFALVRYEGPCAGGICTRSPITRRPTIACSCSGESCAPCVRGFHPILSRPAARAASPLPLR